MKRIRCDTKDPQHASVRKKSRRIIRHGVRRPHLQISKDLQLWRRGKSGQMDSSRSCDSCQEGLSNRHGDAKVEQSVHASQLEFVHQLQSSASLPATRSTSSDVIGVRCDAARAERCLT